MSETVDPIEAGRISYQRWRDGLRADPEHEKLYAAEAARGELWLQLVEARLDAGLTQEEVAARLGVSKARIALIERRGFEDCSLQTLHRYLEALGNGYGLEVSVHRSVGAGESVLVGST